MPYFSFVMVCYNNWSFTSNAIESFFEFLNPRHQERGVEFIFVDNGSSDGTCASLEEFRVRYECVAEVIIINLEQNLGYIVGANIGLSKCRGEIITILNNDLIFCPDWFDGLVDNLEKDSAIGVAAPLLTNGSGPENITLNFVSPEKEQAFYKSKRAMEIYSKIITKNTQDILLLETRIVGACIAIKREVLDLIGGLDFWFGIGLFDDDDFSIRVNIAGYKTVIVGNSFIYHVGSATFTKNKIALNSAILANKMKFIHKWKIKCMENITGLYNSREELISKTCYSRQKYFIPVSQEQFSSYSKADENKGKVDKTMLLVADWMNLKSKWLQKLELLMQRIDENVRISLWIPELYFHKAEIDEITRKIFQLMKTETEKDYSAIKFILVDIDALDLLALISSYDSALSVEDDFVNRYITYLARQIGVMVE